MFTIAGTTGQVGSATAKALFNAGIPFQSLSRSEESTRAWTQWGVRTAVADLRHAKNLAHALEGSKGFFVLLPFSPFTAHLDSVQNQMIESITTAVSSAKVPHVVVLSSLGCNLAGAPQVIRWLGELESRLQETPTTVTSIRCTHFQEKITANLRVAMSAGIYPVMASSTQEKIPMVATRDVGEVIADALIHPSGNIIDVTGPEYTETEMASLLGQALGRELDVVLLQKEKWHSTLVSEGMTPRAAELLVELAEAGNQLLDFQGARRVVGTTDLATTLTRIAHPESLNSLH